MHHKKKKKINLIVVVGKYQVSGNLNYEYCHMSSILIYSRHQFFLKKPISKLMCRYITYIYGHERFKTLTLPTYKLNKTYSELKPFDATRLYKGLFFKT